MNINRNNYEYFFLLYIDNELSVAEKNMVDVFLQQNTDLQPEFDALQNTLLQPDLAGFENKDQLFKKETNDLLQQDLLLLLDNELSLEKKQHIQSLIGNDASTAKAWEILQQTKLLPDNGIVFKHKNLLYKNQNTPVIAIFWKRFAIAAILLGFGCWVGVKYYYNLKKPDFIELAASNYLQMQQQTAFSNIDSSNTIAVNPVVNQKKNGPVLTANKLIAKTNQNTKNNKQELSNSNLENINKQKSNIITTTNVLPAQADFILAANETPSVSNRQNLVNEEIADAQKESYAMNEVYDLGEEVSDNKILYFDEEKVKSVGFSGK